MIILRLIHPTHGLCGYQAVYSNYTQRAIVGKWKKKYGKKFDECTVVEEDTVAAKRVIHIPDGQIFDSPQLAADEFNVSKSMVVQHCERKLSGYMIHYRFKWA